MANFSLSERIPELDGLRGAAIAMVVVLHYFYFYPSETHQPSGLIRSAYVHFERVIALGWTGVDLFFVLSGFLIGGILLDSRPSPWYFKSFYIRRFYRIIPLYYVWIFCYAIVTLFAGPFFSAYASSHGEAGTSSRLYLQLVFLQNFGVVGYSYFANSWLMPTWSLAVEEQFYLVAPLVIRLFSKRRLYGFLVLVIALVPLVRLWVRYHIPVRGLPPAYELTVCRSDALSMGILAALLWRSDVVRSWLSDHVFLLYGVVGAFLAGVILLGMYSPSNSSFWMESIGYTWVDGFYTLIMLLVLSVPSGPVARFVRLSWLRELGRVSYCLYIIHAAVGYVCEVLLWSFVRHAESWQSILIKVPAALIAFLIARLSWTYFEYPLLRRGRVQRYFPNDGENSNIRNPEPARVVLGA